MPFNYVLLGTESRDRGIAPSGHQLLPPFTALYHPMTLKESAADRRYDLKRLTQVPGIVQQQDFAWQP